MKWKRITQRLTQKNKIESLFFSTDNDDLSNRRQISRPKLRLNKRLSSPQKIGIHVNAGEMRLVSISRLNTHSDETLMWSRLCIWIIISRSAKRPPNGDGSTTCIEINQSIENAENEICHDNSSSNHHERVHQSMKSFFCVSTFTRSSSSLDTDKARLRRLSVLMRKIEKVDFFLFILSVAFQRHKAGEQEGEWEVSWGERGKREQKLISRSLATHSLTDCVVITLLLPQLFCSRLSDE